MIRFIALLAVSACTIEYDQYKEPAVFWPDSNPPELSDSFHTDEFHIADNEAVDIIIYLDGSCSMVDDQIAIVANLEELPNTLRDYNIDYRLAIMSTDRSEDHSGEFSTSDYLDGQDPWVTPRQSSVVFQDVLDNLEGDGETGNDVVFMSITEKFDKNRNFFRLNVPLHLIVISDEPDQSDISPLRLTLELYKDRLKKLDQIVYSAVVTVPGTDYCPDHDSSIYWGYGYMEVALGTGGDIVDICNPDWSSVFAQIAEKALVIPSKFSLTHLPVEDTINVVIHNGEYTYETTSDDWDYDYSSNSIGFPILELSENEIVEVTYKLR